MALVKILDSIFDMDNAMLNLINIFESGKERFLLYNVDGVIKPRMEEGVVSSIAIDDDDNFVLKFETPNEDNVTFDSEKFFVKPTLLVAKGVTILVEHFNVVGINYTIPETAPVIKHTVKLRSFKGDVDNSLWQNTRQSAIYKIKSDLFQLRKCGVIFDMTTNKNLHSSFKNAVNLVIDKDPILFYVESVSDSQYMMFKSQSEIDHDKFKRIVDSVRVAIGFLSGLYIGDNVYYFACKKDQGIKGLTYKYVNLQESVISKYPILDYGFYRDITEEELSLTSSQFNRLVELIYKNDNVMRAAMLITNAGTLSGVSKGTLASVALETMTSVVMSEQKAENIVEDKNVYRQLEYELKKGLKKIKSLVPQERYTILENKLQQLIICQILISWRSHLN